MNALTELTPKQLRRAADLQERIQALQHQLVAILGAEVSRPAPQPGPKRTRRVTPAGRARLAALARARWAKVKAAGKSRL